MRDSSVGASECPDYCGPIDFRGGRPSGRGSSLNFLFGDGSEVQVFNQGGAILSDLALGALTIAGDGRNRVGDYIAIAGAVRTATRQIRFFDLDDVVGEVGEFFLVENRISFFHESPVLGVVSVRLGWRRGFYAKSADQARDAFFSAAQNYSMNLGTYECCVRGLSERRRVPEAAHARQIR